MQEPETSVEPPGEPAQIPPGASKGWRTTAAASCAMVTLGVVAIWTRDAAIIASVGGLLTTILGIMTQRHTSADLYASAPTGTPGQGPRRG